MGGVINSSRVRFVRSDGSSRCAAPAPGAPRTVAARGMVRRIVALQRVPGAADVRAAVPWLCHPPAHPQLPSADDVPGVWRDA